VNALFFTDSEVDLPKMDKNKCPKSIYKFSNLRKKVKNIQFLHETILIKPRVLFI
tara:strand:- start:667 stop:831 length:165 start_codon:yes stop_codon:yes gene_type:complete